MPDGLPFHLAEQRCDSNRQIGQLEQWEGKGIQYPLPERTIANFFMFRNHGDCTHKEQGTVITRNPEQQGFQHALQQMGHIGRAKGCHQQNHQITDQDCNGYQHRRHDRHGQIIAGKFLDAMLGKNTAAQPAAILCHNLIKALGPTHALGP